MQHQMIHGGHKTLLQQGDGLQHVGEMQGLLETLTDFGRDVTCQPDSASAFAFSVFAIAAVAASIPATLAKVLLQALPDAPLFPLAGGLNLLLQPGAIGFGLLAPGDVHDGQAASRPDTAPQASIHTQRGGSPPPGATSRRPRWSRLPRPSRGKR